MLAHPLTIAAARAPACLLLLVMAGASLAADTVELRNGRRIQNVRTTVRGGRIFVTESGGRTESFPARDVKSIVPAEVNWPRIEPRKEQPKREEPKREEPKVIEPRPVKEPTKKEEPVAPKAESTKRGPSVGDRVLPFLEGLTPGWSGHYRQGRPWVGGFATLLELYALARLLPWIPPPRPYEGELVTQIALSAFLVLPPGAPPPPPGALPPFNSRYFIDTYGLVATLRLSAHPVHDGYLNRRDADANRITWAVALGAALVLDGVTSALFVRGETPQKKSAAIARETNASFYILPRPEGGIVAGAVLRL